MEVISAYVTFESKMELLNYQKQLDYSIDTIDKTLISEHAKSIIIQKYVLSHLMLTLSNGMDKILIKYYCYGLVNRTSILKLLAIIQTIENMKYENTNNILFRDLFKITAQPLLKELVLHSLIESCNGLLDSIDKIENNNLI